MKLYRLLREVSSVDIHPVELTNPEKLVEKICEEYFRDMELIRDLGVELCRKLILEDPEIREALSRIRELALEVLREEAEMETSKRRRHLRRTCA
jgi:predicted metal-dependent RNase